MAQCYLTPRLERRDYRTYRTDAIFGGNKWDPQIFDRTSISDRAIIVGEADWREISEAAEGLSLETIALETQIQAAVSETKSERFLSRRAYERLRNLDKSSSKSCVRMMRFDFHPTEEGWKVSEVNSDVPGGLNEASTFHHFWPQRNAHWKSTGEPAAAYAKSVVDRYGLTSSSLVGLIHATAYSDDWQHMAFLKTQFQNLGIEAEGLSPTNVELKNGKLSYRDRDLSAALRFFPGDWLLFSRWGNAWFENHPANLSNPLWSLFSQNKYFPVVCEALGIELHWWKKYLPRTQRLLLSDIFKSDEILKPSFGRVGEDVGFLSKLRGKKRFNVFLDILFSKGLWVKQRPFSALNLGNEHEPITACVGVYCLDGKVVGSYGRLSNEKFIGITAADCPVFVTN